MAYCDKCGAYIPDGIVECYACGYDPEVEAREKAEAEARAKAEAQAAERQPKAEKYSYDRNGADADGSAAAAAGAAAGAAVEAVFGAVETFADGVRKHVAEEKRRMQQEADREWAEREYERRQEEARAEEYFNAQPKPASNLHRIMSALSYLSFGCFIVRFLFGDDEFTKYHSAQGIRLFIFSIIADIINFIPFLGVAATLFRLYCIYKGMTNALNCKVEPLPVIGENKKK